MKRISHYLAIITVLTLNAFSFPVQAQEVTIGVVNTSRILQQSPQAEAMQAQLEEEFSDRRESLISNQKKLKGMMEKMERDSAIMSQAERQEMQSQIAQLQRDLKREQAAFREDFQYRRNQELSSIRDEIIQAVRTVAKQNGYDLVLGQGVVHASNQVNITDQVIEYLQESAG